MPTTAWAGFPPGPPKPGHPRTKSLRPLAHVTTKHCIQPNAQMARATFSAWGRRARAFFSFTLVPARKLRANANQPTLEPEGCPLVWVDSPPLIRPGRGRLARVEGLEFRV